MREKLAVFEKVMIYTDVFLIFTAVLAYFLYSGRFSLGMPIGALIGYVSFRMIVFQIAQMEKKNGRKMILAVFLGMTKFALIAAAVWVFNYSGMANLLETAAGLFLSQVALIVSVFHSAYPFSASENNKTATV
ncbi:MAG: hypothetical protein HQM10_15790 [Candidatus Riflebacteria bacterium]|nr:hypothetical protein [Candidatus Riflebacteria bacterium]